MVATRACAFVLCSVLGCSSTPTPAESPSLLEKPGRAPEESAPRAADAENPSTTQAPTVPDPAPFHTVLQALASSSAPEGAVPMDPVLGARFEEGQRLETLVELKPGRCYTFLGVGMPPIENVDLEIVANPDDASPEVVARDDTSSPTAVLGHKPDCLKWPKQRGSTKVKLVLRVSRGAGFAYAELYQK